jgi:rod shape-determining protein MreC
MKSRIILIVILLIILLILTGHNNTGLQRMVLDWINPIRIAYKEFTNEIKSKSETYIFQKQEIERLKEENRVLRKYLFDQTSYLKQLKTVYDVIPSLEKIPYRNVIMVDTISYVKLNKFDEILLNAPEGYQLKEGKIYGLIQKEHVGGVAKVEDGHLYGYLISNQKCSFGVSIGKERYSGVAFGKD